MCSKLFVSFYSLYCTIKNYVNTKNIYVKRKKQRKCKEVTPFSANKFNYSRMRLVNKLKKKINVRGSIFLSISLLSFNFLEREELQLFKQIP